MQAIANMKGLFQAHPMLTPVLIAAAETIILYHAMDRRFRISSQDTNTKIDAKHRDILNRLRTMRELDDRLKAVEDNVYDHHQDLTTKIPSIEKDIESKHQETKKDMDRLQQYIDEQNANISSAFGYEVQNMNKKIQTLSHSVKECIDVTQEILKTKLRKKKQDHEFDAFNSKAAELKQQISQMRADVRQAFEANSQTQIE